MARSNNKIGWSELRVGVFVLAAFGVLMFLLLNATGDFNPFDQKLHLKARFESADGLRPGSEVQLAGVKIGKVDTVSLLPPNEAGESNIEATMLISSKVGGRPITERVRTDSTAQLVATTVLGNDKLINITPGTANGDAVVENHILESKAAISINQLTSTGNDLLGQINKLSVPINEILNKANKGEGTLGKVINDSQVYDNLNLTMVQAQTAITQAKGTIAQLENVIVEAKNGDGTAGKLLKDPALYNNVNQTVEQLQNIAADLRAGKGTAGKFLSDEKLYSDVDATVTDVRDTLKDARTSIQRLNKIVDQVDAIAADLNAGKGTAGKLLKDEALYTDTRNAINRLNSTAEKVELLIADAQSGKGTIGKLLTDDSLFNNINQTSNNVNQLSAEGTKMIYDFRQNPKKYLTIKLKLF